MEASDVFAQEVTGADDPFAGTDDVTDAFGPGPGSESDAFEEEPVRTVDREGNEVTPDPRPAEAGTAPSAAEPSHTTPQAGERAEAAPDPLDGGAANGAVTPPTPSEAPVAAEQRTDPGAGVAAPFASEPVPTPAAAPADASAAATGPSAGESSSSTTASAPAEGGEPDEEEEAPVPDETKDKSGRVTRRRYLIFKVDGPGKLSQVNWYEDAKGNLTERTTGAKRQTVYLARGTDDALKFGYLAAGAPKGGIKLVAVAALHFQLKEVKPVPPEPSRTRLTIN